MCKSEIWIDVHKNEEEAMLYVTKQATHIVFSEIAQQLFTLANIE